MQWRILAWFLKTSVEGHCSRSSQCLWANSGPFSLQLDDPLTAFPAFKKYDRNGYAQLCSPTKAFVQHSVKLLPCLLFWRGPSADSLSHSRLNLEIECKRVTALNPLAVEWAFELTRTNMQTMWGSFVCAAMGVVVFFYLNKLFFSFLQVRTERVGLEREGKAGGDERREGLVPTGKGWRLQPPGVLPLPVRRGVWGGGFILVIHAKALTCRFKLPLFKLFVTLLYITAHC